MGGFKTVIYEKTDRIAWVTLNRPESLNAYDTQMRDDLYQVLGAIRDDPEVRVALFRGAGDRAFCAGADLREFLTAPPPVTARRVRFTREVWGLFLSLPQPLIAALHGYVLGSGLEIALCCDLRVASPDARFRLPELGLGIIPAAGGTQTLPRLIGPGRALDMLLTGRWLSAEEAFGFGLVNRLVPREDLIETAGEIAARIAAHDPTVSKKAKEAVVRGLDLPLPSALDLERRLAAEIRQRVRRLSARENEDE